MPNERRSSSHRYRASPYSRCSKNGDKTTLIGNENDWEETRCCICMEHPHNAVLLHCSSRENGCLPYICDTSARHSNCLDQFKKTSGEQAKLACPLCRGQIHEWIVVNAARQFMNSKTRSCSMGSCEFYGNYSQLREHARCQHPWARPTDVDPKRELEWSKLEHDMEQLDMLSMQFAFDDNDDDEDDVVAYADAEDIEIMDGFYELASPIWDPDMDMLHFFRTFESEFESFLTELDLASENNNLLLNDWDNAISLSSSSSHESEIEESSTRREIARTSRIRNNARGRQRSNSQPSSHNRQQQVTTLVDFHELRSSMP